MKKPNKNFFQQLQQRIPDALKQERVVVTPIDRLATQEQEEKPQVDKSTSSHTDENVYPHVDKSPNTQTSETTNRQAEKEISGQNRKITSGEIVKYTTHLRPVTVKAIKRYAVEHDLKDYEIVQEALDRFFNQAGN
jgi:hypothetical protein